MVDGDDWKGPRASEKHSRTPLCVNPADRTPFPSLPYVLTYGLPLLFCYGLPDYETAVHPFSDRE